ncbi:MAG: hypothetical protein AAFR98_03640 [Pseudomonadota bacterium]
MDFSGGPYSKSILQMHHISDSDAAIRWREELYPAEIKFANSAIEICELKPNKVKSEATLIHHDQVRIVLGAFRGEAKKKLGFIRTPDGKTTLGGRPPSDFVFPSADFNSGFQYLGKIDLTHIGADWALNLIYPLFTHYHPCLVFD